MFGGFFTDGLCPRASKAPDSISKLPRCARWSVFDFDFNKQRVLSTKTIFVFSTRTNKPDDVSPTTKLN